MKFFESFKKRKFLLFNIFFSLYIVINLIGGERGLVSYFHKKNTYQELLKKNEKLTVELSSLDHKISLIINVEYRLIEEVKMKKLNISVIGDHLTSKNYSDTLSNEKSVIESLIEQAAKKIVSKIAANLK